MENVIYQRNTLFSCPPKCPMHGVTRRIMNAAELITLKQETDNSWACAMWYTPMIFHSIPSSNSLKTTLVAGCFSSHKKRQTQPQVKDCVQSLFFPSGKGKSWCNGPAGAVWHSNGGHLDDSHGTSMETPGAQGKNTCGLGRRGYIGMEAQGNTARLYLRVLCQNLPLAACPQKVPNTSESRGISRMSHTTQQLPQRGHSQGWSQEWASAAARTRAQGTPWATPWLSPCPHLGLENKHSHHSEAPERHSPGGARWKAEQCFMCYYSTTQLISGSVLSITHQAKNYRCLLSQKATWCFQGVNSKCQPFTKSFPLSPRCLMLPAPGCLLQHALLT